MYFKVLMMLKTQVEKLGGIFRVSDMYRDWMMQVQAHHDWKTGEKVAYSPPPSQSFHNAARSIDVDTQLIEESLNPTGYAKNGLYKYTVDGIWGQGTERALQKYFQRSEGNYLFDKVLGFYGLLEDKIDQTIKKRFGNKKLSIESLSRRNC